MKLTRRNFLKVSGATTGAALIGVFDVRKVLTREDGTTLRIKYARQTTTICPYCGCGCGFIVHASKGKVINIEGDPDHPINRGSVCSKGAALYQVANNDARLKKVRYRASGSDHWENVTWDWAIERISYLAKKTRDEGFPAGQTYNGIDTIAAIGGAALDNEECYLYSKLMRALGVRYIEHQARI
jgi:formate dehydrogenase major subunit